MERKDLNLRFLHPTVKLLAFLGPFNKTRNLLSLFSVQNMQLVKSDWLQLYWCMVFPGSHIPPDRAARTEGKL